MNVMNSNKFIELVDVMSRSVQAILELEDCCAYPRSRLVFHHFYWLIVFLLELVSIWLSSIMSSHFHANLLDCHHFESILLDLCSSPHFRMVHFN